MINQLVCLYACVHVHLKMKTWKKQFLFIFISSLIVSVFYKRWLNKEQSIALAVSMLSFPWRCLMPVHDSSLIWHCSRVNNLDLFVIFGSQPHVNILLV